MARGAAPVIERAARLALALVFDAHLAIGFQLQCKVQYVHVPTTFYL